MVFFWTFNSSNNPEKMYHWYKTIKQHNCFIVLTLTIIRNVSWAPKQYLKDYETLKAGVMNAEISALPSQE